MSNKTYDLAYWFVTEYLGREWTVADNKGVHLNHAKSVLKDYIKDDIMGCLSAIKSGIIEVGNYEIRFLTDLRKLEPPLINRWLEYKATPPPIYEHASYNDWLARTHQSGPEPEPESIFFLSSPPGND